MDWTYAYLGLSTALAAAWLALFVTRADLAGKWRPSAWERCRSA